MANFNLSLSSAVTYRSVGGTFKPSTTTPFISPIFEGSSLVASPAAPLNFSFSDLGSSYSFSTPKRPGAGQLYPRGNQ